MTADDDVTAACAALAGYLPTLENLLPETPSEGWRTGTIGRHPTCSAEPGNRPAWNALMTIHAGVRHLEAGIMRAVTGNAPHRNGSDGNTYGALSHIPAVVAALDEDGARKAAWFLRHWINGARLVDGIDEARRWRALPRQPGTEGELPHPCPYCRTFAALRADVDAMVVECHLPGCEDRDGNMPTATMAMGAHGPELAWADGLTETVPALALHSLYSGPLEKTDLWQPLS